MFWNSTGVRDHPVLSPMASLSLQPFSLFSLYNDAKGASFGVARKRQPIKKGSVMQMEVMLEPNSNRLTMHPRDMSIFQPGDEISGKVSVEVFNTLRFRSLSVTLKCVARVWTKQRKGILLRNEINNEDVNYICIKRHILGGLGSSARQRLPEGRHEFPFDFTLPSNLDLPSSFEGKNGYIRYTIEADLDESYAANHKSVRVFKVVVPVEVWSLEEYRTGLSVSTVVPIRFPPYCSSVGEFVAKIWTKKRVFRPGDDLKLYAQFSNLSLFAVTPEVTLVQKQIFSPTHCKNLERSVVLVSRDAAMVLPGMDGDWDGFHIRLPHSTPSIANCRLIQIEYEVKVLFHYPTQLDMPSLSLPFLLANFSLSQPSPVRPMTPPPSYEACLLSKTDPPSYEDIITNLNANDLKNHMKLEDA